MIRKHTPLIESANLRKLNLPWYFTSTYFDRLWQERRCCKKHFARSISWFTCMPNKASINVISYTCAFLARTREEGPLFRIKRIIPTIKISGSYLISAPGFM